jgi:hypothetical protein
MRDGVGTDAKRRGDLAIGAAGCEQAQDLDLSRTEPGREVIALESTPRRSARNRAMARSAPRSRQICMPVLTGTGMNVEGGRQSANARPAAMGTKSSSAA